MRAAPKPPHPVQKTVDLGMVSGAHLDGAAVRVGGVDVVVVDQATARAGRVTKDQVNEAVVARKVAPLAGVVRRLVHEGPLP